MLRTGKNLFHGPSWLEGIMFHANLLTFIMSLSVPPGVGAFFVSIHTARLLFVSHLFDQQFFPSFFPSPRSCVYRLCDTAFGGSVPASPLQCVGVLDACEAVTVHGGPHVAPPLPTVPAAKAACGVPQGRSADLCPIVAVPLCSAWCHKPWRSLPPQLSRSSFPGKCIFLNGLAGHDHRCLRYRERLMTQGHTHISERT